MKKLPHILLSFIGISLFSFVCWQVFKVSYLPLGPDDGGEVLGWSTSRIQTRKTTKNLNPTVLSQMVLTSFEDNFTTTSTLEESGSMSSSSSAKWWMNSGGTLYIGNGVAQSIQGELPTLSKWRLAYLLTNSEDTDNGYHPQNILRLVLRSKWKNFTQEVHMLINKDNSSASSNRNESNGLFLFNRYLDGQNLYYTGLRVDGAVVIKKKTKGVYYTMAYQKFLPGNYNATSSPNLIPKNQWIGLKSTLTNLPNNEVEIRFYLDLQNNGEWVQVLVAKDDGKKYGGAAIINEGFAGIRTDFMDVSLKSYKIQNQFIQDSSTFLPMPNVRQ